MDRLPTAAQDELVEEIIGRRPARPTLRLDQMNELGVFSIVTEAVHQELYLAETALAPHLSLAPAPLLMRLCEVLRHQVGALRERPQA